MTAVSSTETEAADGDGEEKHPSNGAAGILRTIELYVFQPIAVETFCPFNQSGLDFIIELGRLLQNNYHTHENLTCFSACLSQFRDLMPCVL